MPARDTRQFTIEWSGVRILARDTREMSLDKLIRSKAGDGDHYYIARETDANFLRVAAPQARSRVEHERDLFYRGLGVFQAPLAVGMDTDEQALSLNAREAEQIHGAFLIAVRKGMMRYQKIEGADRERRSGDRSEHTAVRCVGRCAQGGHAGHGAGARQCRAL